MMVSACNASMRHTAKALPWFDGEFEHVDTGVVDL